MMEHTVQDSFGPKIANKRIAEPRNCNAAHAMIDQRTPKGVLSDQEAIKKVGRPTRIVNLFETIDFHY